MKQYVRQHLTMSVDMWLMNLSITLLSHRVRLCQEPSLFNTLHTTACCVLAILRTIFTGHSFSCTTALNCGSSHPGRRPLQALRWDVSFFTDAGFLHDSAILPTAEIQDCDCAGHDCLFNAMDHAFSSQGTNYILSFLQSAT